MARCFIPAERPAEDRGQSPAVTVVMQTPVCRTSSWRPSSSSRPQQWRGAGLTGWRARLTVCLCVVVFAALGSAEQWSGRACCEVLLTPQCRNACQKAKSKEDVQQPGCDFADEPTFFRCVDRKEESAKCCNPAAPQCSAICKVFLQEPTTSQLQRVQEFCSPQVASCVQNYTKTGPAPNPAQSLPCCEHAPTPTCKEHCRVALETLTSEEEIINEVVEHCGRPDLGAALWQCFLTQSVDNLRDQYPHGGRIEETGIDGAKLQCCATAKTESCRDLCVKTFSRQWTSASTKFHDDCGYNARESELTACLLEVEQPCKLGCSGLSFCTHFNHRPTQLFRSCTVAADQAARQAITQWERGSISLPAFTDQYIPVKDIRQCQPEMWKAIACTLHIKPCNMRNVLLTSICKSNCTDILTSCLDRSRLPPGVTPGLICNMLSPKDSQAPCIPLSQYLVDSPYKDIHHEVGLPCHSNPCQSGEVCMVHRRKCKHTQNCTPYICKKACPMGESSTYSVAQGSYVKLPIADSTHNQLHCHRVCKCGNHQVLHRCKEIACKEAKFCHLGSGRIQNHNSKFTLGCNNCACYAGDPVCTSRQCLSSRASEAERRAYTGVPCNCTPQYMPVCGSDGRTYHSACLAQCLELKDSQYENGPCTDVDPCAREPCGPDEKCLRRSQVCLSLQSQCKQYECVKLTGECNRHSHDPVCDTREEEYSNTCTLLHDNRQLGYRGHCMTGCSNIGRVCAVNGESFDSECEAWAAGVPMDYTGPCNAIGQLLDRNPGEPSCPGVECPAMNPKCRPVTPPGACCPKCAAEIRILYSRTMIDAATAVTPHHIITIAHVIQVFRQHMSMAECDAFGYISVEGDLVMLIMPITRHPTPLQIKACMKEADKLGSLISSRSPTFVSHLEISSFISASVRTSAIFVSSTSSSSSVSESPSFHFIALLALTLYFTRTDTWTNR